MSPYPPVDERPALLTPEEKTLDTTLRGELIRELRKHGTGLSYGGICPCGATVLGGEFRERWVEHVADAIRDMLIGELLLGELSISDDLL